MSSVTPSFAVSQNMPAIRPSRRRLHARFFLRSHVPRTVPREHREIAITPKSGLECRDPQGRENLRCVYW